MTLVNSKAKIFGFISFLEFEKLNVLNKELQGANMTLVNSKAKIFGFISFLELSQENISVKNEATLNNFIG